MVTSLIGLLTAICNSLCPEKNNNGFSILNQHVEVNSFLKKKITKKWSNYISVKLKNPKNKCISKI